MSRTAKNRLEYPLALVVIAILFLLLYSPALAGYWAEKDDWANRLIPLDHDAHPQLLLTMELEHPAQIYTEPFTAYGITSEAQVLGRNRFAYWLIGTVEAYLFQQQPQAWQLETLMIGILTISLFYYTLRQSGISPLVSTLLTLPLIFAGHRLWIEKQIAEEPGLLVFLLAAWLLSLRIRQPRAGFSDWLALLLLFISGWIKESFLLAGPALLLIRVGIVWCAGYSWRDLLRNFVSLLIAYGLGFAVQIGIVLMTLSAQSYGGKALGDISFTSRLNPLTALQMIAGISFTFPLLAGWLLLFHRRMRPSDWKYLLLGIGAATLAWLPQVLLYNRDGRGIFLQSYYIFPAYIFLQFGAAVGLELVRRRLPRLVSAGLLLAAFALIAYRIIGIFPSIPNDSTRLAAQSIARAQLEQIVYEAATPDSQIVLAGAPYLERAYSFLTGLSEQDIQATVRLIELPEITNDFYGALVPEWTRTFIPPVDDPDAVTIIAAFVPLDVWQVNAPDWFHAPDWEQRRITVTYPRIELHLRQFAVQRSWMTFEYNVFIRSTGQDS